MLISSDLGMGFGGGRGGAVAAGDRCRSAAAPVRVDVEVAGGGVSRRVLVINLFSSDDFLKKE